jgi:hypothetical protein
MPKSTTHNARITFTLVAIILSILFLAGASFRVYASGLNLPADQVDPTPTPGATETPVVTANPLPSATVQPNPHLGGDCLDCHGNPALTGETLNGETISLYIQPSEHQESFHSREGGGCNKFCHQAQVTYPHETSTIESCAVCHWKDASQPSQETRLVFKLPYNDPRAITLEVNTSCQKCHVEIFEAITDSAHTRIMQEGNRFAPVCSDCHSGHDISLVTRQDVSGVCKKCHLAEYLTYKGSVHGAALEANANPDVPTCAGCHGSHTVSGPDTVDFRTTTVKICGDCHSNKSIMDKYGISTDVLSTYMDDAHGLTDFFRKTNLENITRATCFDCHGKHNILTPDNPSSKVYPENLQSTCQQCHKDANIRFPQSWLSHTKLDAEANAGLNLTNLVSWIIVVIAAVVILVLIGLDVRRRVAARRKAKDQKPE